MRRFLLFSGDEFYPSGGWDDFKGDYSTLPYAQIEAGEATEYTWAQVVDGVHRRVVSFRYGTRPWQAI